MVLPGTIYSHSKQSFLAIIDSSSSSLFQVTNVHYKVNYGVRELIHM